MPGTVLEIRLGDRLDIRKFFDTVSWDLIVKAVAAHTDQPWVLLYVQRWLHAPLQQVDGTLTARDRGTPQGSAVSPVLANLFLHYAFDAWMAREFPTVRFERYVDDAVVHCVSEQQARKVLAAMVRVGVIATYLPPVTSGRAETVDEGWVLGSVVGSGAPGPMVFWSPVPLGTIPWLAEISLTVIPGLRCPSA